MPETVVACTEMPETYILWFLEVSSSPFLLNAVIKHHIETYHQVDPNLVQQFLSYIYVEDLVSESQDVESTYCLYVKSKQQLATAGFRLKTRSQFYQLVCYENVNNYNLLLLLLWKANIDIQYVAESSQTLAH